MDVQVGGCGGDAGARSRRRVAGRRADVVSARGAAGLLAQRLREPRPLLGALRLGYRGAEADVFLVDGVLRLGHDRGRAVRGGTLESVYLAPLREFVGRCGALTARGEPFLLTIELKERSRATYDSFATLLGRYADILTVTDRDGTVHRGAIEVVLVGWHPPAEELARAPARLAGLQYRIVSPDRPVPPDDSGLTRLLSVDYGKTMGHWWVGTARRRRWLATLRAAKEAAPGRLLRVYDLPVDPTLYRDLRAAGVDLIGTKAVAASREPLAALAERETSGAP